MTNTLKSGATVLGATLALAVCGATTAAAAPHPASVPTPSAGWSLDVWSPAPGAHAGPGTKPVAGPDRLFLVSPTGSRTQVATWPQNTERVADWSADGSKALLVGTYNQVLDLHSGKRSQVLLPKKVLDAAHATGTGVVYLGFAGRGATSVVVSAGDTAAKDPELWRVSLRDKQATVPMGLGAGAVFSPGGKTFATGLGQKLNLDVTATGKVQRTLSTPRNSWCFPTRFLDARTVLASCFTKTNYHEALWAVPVNGRPATRVTKTPTAGDVIQDDLDAVRTSSGTYVQSAEACGHITLAKVAASGFSVPVQVPGVDDGESITLLGTDGKRLLLQASVACGSGETLFWYDPVSGAEQQLLGAGVNGGGVMSGLLFDRPVD